ncbi:MAG: hypothetical protein E6K80_04905 [Candidatus Eisenbacteria bacterium]|uniref:Uncharacterized protein n=1 Tax=Eiseniibacteriota bacterium TaxID=2212470 RepID=A0A538U6Y4_UNCEI|nr:MAG: hypothetical protein E6K80_04905 [Candidatus Eisenbacteria bacterium]
MLAALALAIALTAVVGCTMIGDSMTGVRLKADGATGCIKDCNDTYKAAFDAEQKLHDANIEACQALSQPDKATCLDDEAARHEAAMTALSAAKTDCQNDCHRQGSGTAG